MIRYILAIMLSACVARAQTIKVAIVDTGAPKVTVQPCESGHKDFTGYGLTDFNGHGTNVSSIIDLYAAGADYCQIYLKYYVASHFNNNQENTIAAFKEAIKLKVDVIIYAGGGTAYSSEEAAIIKQALEEDIFVFAAAGNEKMDFNKTGCKYYPACVDERVVVVGCRKSDGELCTHSNHGKGVDIYANGDQVRAGGVTLTGTSQATAIVTGKFIKYYDSKRKEQ